MLEDITSSQADTESVVDVTAADVGVSPFSLDASEENVVERGKKSLMGVHELPVEDVCEAEAGTGADVKEEDVNIVGGVADVGFRGGEFEGFTVSAFLRGKRLSERSVSESAVNNSHLPQCVFSNLQRLPLSSQVEIFCWPITEFC